jgi:hypothetical protein
MIGIGLIIMGQVSIILKWIDYQYDETILSVSQERTVEYRLTSPIPIVIKDILLRNNQIYTLSRLTNNSNRFFISVAELTEGTNLTQINSNEILFPNDTTISFNNLHGFGFNGTHFLTIASNNDTPMSNYSLLCFTNNMSVSKLLPFPMQNLSEYDLDYYAISLVGITDQNIVIFEQAHKIINFSQDVIFTNITVYSLNELKRQITFSIPARGIRWVSLDDEGYVWIKYDSGRSLSSFTEYPWHLKNLNEEPVFAGFSLTDGELDSLLYGYDIRSKLEQTYGDKLQINTSVGAAEFLFSNQFSKFASTFLTNIDIIVYYPEWKGTHLYGFYVMTAEEYSSVFFPLISPGMFSTLFGAFLLLYSIFLRKKGRIS